MNGTATDTSVLNRRILRIYWLIIILTAIVGLTVLTIDFLLGGDQQVILARALNFIVKPLTCMLLLAAVGEWMMRRHNWMASYAGMIVSNLLPIILIVFFTEVKGVQFSLLFGVMASALYYKQSKVILSSVYAGLAILVLMAVYAPFRNQMDLLTVIFSFVCISCFTLLANAILQEGSRLRSDLRQYEEDHKMLVADVIEKDYITKKDTLTQAYNRLAFDELLGALSSRDYIFTLAIFDVDDFKHINDTYGHLAGDKVLISLADCVTRSLPADDYFFRYGGEEFVIIYFEKSPQETIVLSEQLRQSLEQMRVPELGDRHITISMGLAERKLGQSIEDLRQVADRLLYQAKRLGKNQVQYEEQQPQ